MIESRLKMSGNEFQSDLQMTPTTYEVSSRSSTKEANRCNKRLARRIQWLGDDARKPQEYDNCGVKKQTSIRPTIHRSMASTDLTSNLIHIILIPIYATRKFKMF